MYQAACVLPHDSTLPSQTSVSPADRTEFSFVSSSVEMQVEDGGSEKLKMI
jgi:hypothetical protein